MTLGIVVINLVLLCIIVCCFSFCPALVSEYFLSNRLAPVYFFGFIIPFISFKQFVNGFMLFICSVFGLIVGGFCLFIYLFVIKPILSSLGHTAFSFLCLICCSGSLIIFSLWMLVLELFFHQFRQPTVYCVYFEIRLLQLQRFVLQLPFD